MGRWCLMKAPDDRCKGSRISDVSLNADSLPRRKSDRLFCTEELKGNGYLASWLSRMGAGSWLLNGRKLKNSRTFSKASTSFSKAWWATPENKTSGIFNHQKTTFQCNSLFSSLHSKVLQPTRHSGVSFGPPELLLSHVFIGNRLHNIWSCDEQVWRVLRTSTNTRANTDTQSWLFLIYWDK